MSVSVSSDKSVREAYEADASGLRLLPDLVARPESANDVIELVRKAASDRIAITCAGAQTSTTGASITDKGMLLSLRSLDKISLPDERARTIRVEPGALVGDIKRTAAAAGLLFAPDQPVKRSQQSAARSRATPRVRERSSTARHEGMCVRSRW